jgi:hypothetical protein
MGRNRMRKCVGTDGIRLEWFVATDLLDWDEGEGGARWLLGDGLLRHAMQGRKESGFVYIYG